MTRAAFVLPAFVLACVVACASSENAADDAGPAPADAGSDVVDAKPQPVDAAPTCGDGKLNGAESDVDCGGSCAKCDDGKTCKLATDCRQGTCLLGHCSATTWFAETNGSNVVVPGNMTWVPAPGASIDTILYDTATVFLRFTGTSRFAGGGNGVCHLGQRFLIDGKPTGNPSWGNAIMVQRGDLRWHEMFTTEMAITLPKGPHSFSAEVTNANGYANCYIDGDGGQPYDRSRLAVAAFDPAQTFYVESTGGTGNLATGSGFTAIPGVALNVKLAAPQHVQLSLSGTQLNQGSGASHCAYRFVVDGTPLGNPNHGQAVYVGDVGGGWWSPVTLKYGMDLPAGTHLITAEIANSASGGGTCQAGEGNNDYSKFRLFATASTPGGATTSIESAGPSNVLGSGSAWTPVSGLSAPITLATDRSVQLELAATQRNVSGSGHCAWRFVVDGKPLGQPDHGQAINVGDGSYTWWNAAALLWSQPLTAGPHTIGVQVRNSSSSGDCGTNADSEPYSRARLLIRAP
jgi:hypothetical protein